ncbi:MAG: XTP/dITP diphosphatase [Candidatus Micrarchaeota archaeon]
MEIHFATSNVHKFKEAQEMLKDARVELKRFGFEYREIRSESLEEIARDAAAAAFGRLKKPVFVEDSGLFIDSLNGFPGTYSGWTFGKIGSGGMLRLLAGAKERSAHFGSCVAFADGKGVKTFSGTCRGTISPEARGTGGFGYDPIFVPEGHNETFAQSIILKNKLSHRYNSLLKFSNYLRKTQ